MNSQLRHQPCTQSPYAARVRRFLSQRGARRVRRLSKRFAIGLVNVAVSFTRGQYFMWAGDEKTNIQQKLRVALLLSECLRT